MAQSQLPKHVYEYLADFRYQLRKFIRFSESAARSVGITPQHHQLLLAIKGYPERDFATPGELAERLQITQHACVELIKRCESIGLVCRKSNPEDRRSVYIEVTGHGMEVLEQLSILHLEEIERIGLIKSL